MAKDENLECSFCGRKKSETDLLIAGMDAHICDKCIEQAHGIVEEEIADVPFAVIENVPIYPCLLYTSPSPRD